ncbi:MAG: hypothetical protein CR993_00145 [Rhodobacterales bacterium]|nr:MAG: hypothetical protein CR993_00145 [Rhodobacterales bacterium]
MNNLFDWYFLALVTVMVSLFAFAVWRSRKTAGQSGRIVEQNAARAENQKTLIELQKRQMEVQLRQAEALERIAAALEAQSGE